MKIIARDLSFITHLVMKVVDTLMRPSFHYGVSDFTLRSAPGEELLYYLKCLFEKALPDPVLR